MKRPTTLYFVAVWSCLALLIQASILTRSMRTYQAAGEPVPVIWSFLPVAALIFDIWQTIGLVQLKRINRWVVVVFFVLWTISLIWNGTVAVQHLATKPGKLTNVFFLIVFFLTLVSFNLLSAWYLGRRSFGEFTVHYNKEKHSEAMQKLSQKRVLDDIRKRH
jgi:hypothetical protein